MDKLNLNIQEHITLYQSRFFEKYFPEDNNKFKNVVLTDIIDKDREKSLLEMKTECWMSMNLLLGFFIGGMEGVEKKNIKCS